MSGQDTEPGATFFQVFVSMCDTVHEPLFKAIEFTVDLKSCDGHVKVPGRRRRQDRSRSAIR